MQASKHASEASEFSCGKNLYFTRIPNWSVMGNTNELWSIQRKGSVKPNAILPNSFPLLIILLLWNVDTHLQKNIFDTIFITRKLSSRMRIGGGGSPWQRPPLGQRPPWMETPWTETTTHLEGTWDQRQRPPLEGTWDQSARQEVTSYRDHPREQNDTYQ